METSTEPRYDMTFYKDRFLFFYRMTSPKNMLIRRTQIDECQQVLAAIKTNPKAFTIGKIWEAEDVATAVLHPNTGKKIFPLLSWAWFVPMNIPILCGMLFSAQTTFNIVFWQIMNQSYNFLVNYTYRNPSVEASNMFLAVSYSGAVATSCAVGLSMKKWFSSNEHTLKEPLKSALRISVPFVAVACANMFNLVISKSSEMSNGIPLLGPNKLPVYQSKRTGQCYEGEGKQSEEDEEYLSKLAGIRSVLQSGVTRMLMPAPVLYLTPLAKEALVAAGRWPKSGKVGMLCEVCLCAFALRFSLPIAIAAFDSTGTIPMIKFEGAEFDTMRESGVEELYFKRSL